MPRRALLVSASRQLRLSLGLAAGLSCCSSAVYALPFATGRAGGGYTYLGADKGGKSASSGTLSGAGRFGYLLDESHIFFALDANAYRVYKAGDLKANQDGTSALAVVGFEYSATSFWLGAGAGELRSYDREGDKARPYRFYTNEYALGSSIQLYAADYARVELGAMLSRVVPDADWRAKTGFGSLNSLQIDIGFKLFNW